MCLRWALAPMKGLMGWNPSCSCDKSVFSPVINGRSGMNLCSMWEMPKKTCDRQLIWSSGYQCVLFHLWMAWIYFQWMWCPREPVIGSWFVPINASVFSLLISGESTLLMTSMWSIFQGVWRPNDPLSVVGLTQYMQCLEWIDTYDKHPWQVDCLLILLIL